MENTENTENVEKEIQITTSTQEESQISSEKKTEIIEETGKAQVSMNLVNPDYTTIFRVFDMVEREAHRYGVSVTDSEIVGLVPMKALIDTAIYHLKLDNFSMDQVLETRIWE
mgnify:CR=1 FL=1